MNQEFRDTHLTFHELRHVASEADILCMVVNGCNGTIRDISLAYMHLPPASSPLDSLENFEDFELTEVIIARDSSLAELTQISSTCQQQSVQTFDLEQLQEVILRQITNYLHQAESHNRRLVLVSWKMLRLVS